MKFEKFDQYTAAVVTAVVGTAIVAVAFSYATRFLTEFAGKLP